MRDTVLSAVFTTCPESLLLQKLMWIVPVKNNVFPCPAWKRLVTCKDQATAVCSQDSRTYEIGSFWLGVLISQCQCHLREWYISAWNIGRVSHSKTQACATSPSTDSRVITLLIKGKTKQNLHSDSLPERFFATSYTHGFPAEAIWTSVFSFRKVSWSSYFSHHTSTPCLGKTLFRYQLLPELHQWQRCTTLKAMPRIWTQVPAMSTKKTTLVRFCFFFLFKELNLGCHFFHFWPHTQAPPTFALFQSCTDSCCFAKEYLATKWTENSVFLLLLDCIMH